MDNKKIINIAKEVEEARGANLNLKERLDNFDSRLDTKANKKEIYLNVKDFGAKGDGVNDDAIAIQSALNYATNNLKTVYIPRGNYKIGNTLLIPDNTHLKGDNRQFTILSPTDKFKNSMINKTLDGIISHNLICNSNFMSSEAIAYNSNTNIEISDIFFKWGDDKSLPEYANNCIGLNNSKQIKIYDCSFRNWGQHSIDIAGCSDVFIERNINLFGYWSSVQVDEGGGLYQAPPNPNYSKSTRVYIRDNFFQENAFITGSIQIHKNGGTNIFIENNVIVGSLVGICTDEYWTANYTAGYNNNLVIRNNIIDSASISNTIGIQIAKNYDNVVIENNFSNCYFPIKIRGGKPNYWNEHIVIKNNTFNGKECEMIGLSNSIVSDNTFNLSFNRPIVVAKNSVFSNNIFKGFGVRIKDVKETDPRDNSIYSYESENITFEKNIFTDLSNPSSFTFTDVGSPRKFKFLYNNYFNYTSRIDFGSFSDKSKIIIEDDYSQRKETVSSSTRPATPIIGMCVFDETLKKPIWYNGTNWIDATGITV